MELLQGFGAAVALFAISSVAAMILLGNALARGRAKPRDGRDCRHNGCLCLRPATSTTGAWRTPGQP